MALKKAELVLHRGGNPYVRLYFQSKPFDPELLRPSLFYPNGAVGNTKTEIRPQFAGGFLIFEIISTDDSNLFAATDEIRLGFSVPAGETTERQFYSFVPMS